MTAGEESERTAKRGEEPWRALASATVRAGEAAVDLLGRPEVATAWARPSVLPTMTVGALAAHLGQMLAAGAAWLETDRSEEPLVASSAVEVYGLARLGPAGIEGEVAEKIRSWSAAGAHAGPAAVSTDAAAYLARLTELLPTADPTRLIPSVMAAGRGMTLPDYLRSRCVELLVHADDLARSVELPDLLPDPTAAGEAIAILIELCRARSGDLAVLRAFAGRQPDDRETLRAL